MDQQPIDPGYGESMIQPRPEATREELIARHEKWARENRAEALRKAREILKASPKPLPPPRRDFLVALILVHLTLIPLGIIPGEISQDFVPFCAKALLAIDVGVLGFGIGRRLHRRVVDRAPNLRGPEDRN